MNEDDDETLDLIRRLAAGDETAVEPAKAAAAETDVERAAWVLEQMAHHDRSLIRHDCGHVSGWRITHYWRWPGSDGAVCFDQHIELLYHAGLVHYGLKEDDPPPPNGVFSCTPTAKGKDMAGSSSAKERLKAGGPSRYDIERYIAACRRRPPAPSAATTPPTAP